MIAPSVKPCQETPPEIVALTRHIQSAQLRQAFERQRLSAVLSLGIIAAAYWPLAVMWPSRQMAIWAACALFVLAARSLVARAFRSSNEDLQYIRRWRLIFILGAAAGGLSWALGPLLLYHLVPPAQVLLLTVIVISVSAVAMSQMSALFPALLAFVLAALVPTGAALLTVDDPAYLAGALMVFAASGMLVLTGRAAARVQESLLRAEFRLGHALEASRNHAHQQALAAAALQAARDAAQQASRAKSAFLATMSHELRTPLNAVIGAAQLLRSSNAGTEERHALLAAIENGGMSLLGLIESVMDLSRIEAAELRLAQEPFDLVDCIDRAVGTVSIPALDRGIRVAAIVSPEVASRRVGDAARLRQVLLNLLGNAVKFTPSGEVVLELEEMASLPEAPPKLRMTIRDTGIGIHEHALDSIFQPFRQEESGSSRRFAGSGLGLAIVRELVQAMGGEVSVRSEKGKGSCFEVRIPLPVDPAAALPAPQPESEPESGRRPQVALHEPHAATRRALVAALLRQGFDPVDWTVLDEPAGAAAAAPAAQAQPDWLLLADDSGLSPVVRSRLAASVPDERVIWLVDAHRGSQRAAPGLAAAAAQLRLVRPVPQAALAAVLSRAGMDAAPSGVNRSIAVAPADTGVPWRVLLVEDDPTNQVITAGMLVHGGYEVVSVDDGRAALDRLAREPFDLVLMDCQMPGMDGLEVTRRIRAGIAGPKAACLPILAVTANAFREDREACLAAGTNDFVSKPLRLDGLLDTVSRWVRADRPE